MLVSLPRGNSKTNAAAEMATKIFKESTFRETLTSGRSVLVGAWVDNRLIAGIELLADDLPRMNRSAFLREAIIEKLRKHGFIEPEETVKIPINRKLPPRAYVGVRKRGPKESRVKGQQPEDPYSVPVDTKHRRPLLKLLQSLPVRGLENLCKLLLQNLGFQPVQLPTEFNQNHVHGIGFVMVDPADKLKVLVECRQKAFKRTEISAFREALKGKAEKGILVTTRDLRYQIKKTIAKAGSPSVDFITGADLVGIMETKELGVIIRTVFQLDVKFFDGFRNP